MNSNTIQDRLKEFKDEFAGKNVILGVDRLDYIKGIPNKLAGFERFLEKYPKHAENTVLLQIAIPTREEIAEYADLRQTVYTKSGKCNAAHGVADFGPIQIYNNSIPFHELSALYQLADICLITSLRDGMNLVSYEYISSQAQNNGVLILSEFTGASQSLVDALSVNPWDVDDVADKIALALDMNIEERIRRQKLLFEYVAHHTCNDWICSFIDLLNHLDEGKKQCNTPPKCLFLLDDHAFESMSTRPDMAEEHILHLPKEALSTFRRIVDENVIGDLNSLIISSKLPGTHYEYSDKGFSWKYCFGDYDLWKNLSDEIISMFQSHEDSDKYQVFVLY